MQIIVTSFLDELYGLMSRVPDLASLYEKRDISFISGLRAWILNCEGVLEKYHRPQVGDMAALRSRLSAAAEGVSDSSFNQVSTSGSRRKIFHAQAALLLSQGQGILGSQFEFFSTRREQAEKYTNQILLISLQKNTFYPIWNSALTPSGKLNQLWQSFVSDADLVQGTRQILTFVGYPDALRIMDEAITSLHL